MMSGYVSESSSPHKRQRLGKYLKIIFSKD